jgi:hypothetical protein
MTAVTATTPATNVTTVSIQTSHSPAKIGFGTLLTVFRMRETIW